jgi:hypothetical protein
MYLEICEETSAPRLCIRLEKKQLLKRVLDNVGELRSSVTPTSTSKRFFSVNVFKHKELPGMDSFVISIYMFALKFLYMYVHRITEGRNLADAKKGLKFTFLINFKSMSETPQKIDKMKIFRQCQLNNPNITKLAYMRYFVLKKSNFMSLIYVFKCIHWN